MINTPGFSDKISDFTQSGVETFQRCFPQNPGKFCTLINTRARELLMDKNIPELTDVDVTKNTDEAEEVTNATYICPDCGSVLIVIETFGRGQLPRAPSLNKGKS